MKRILQVTIGNVTNFHLDKRRCDKSEEDGIVEDSKTDIFDNKVIIKGALESSMVA